MMWVFLVGTGIAICLLAAAIVFLPRKGAGVRKKRDEAPEDIYPMW
jgi:hypothetical protein